MIPHKASSIVPRIFQFPLGEAWVLEVAQPCHWCLLTWVSLFSQAVSIFLLYLQGVFALRLVQGINIIYIGVRKQKQYYM